MLPPDCELVRPTLSRGRFKAVVFDFDGTLSLIRECWPQVMIPMMVEVLGQTGTGESAADLERVVEEFVMRQNGQPTIHQMTHLAWEVQQRGGIPLHAGAYKDRFHGLLMERIGGRLEALTDGRASPKDWAMPGSHALLEGFRRRGLLLRLASGTERKYVQYEGDLLRLTPFFGPHVYAPENDESAFSKREVVEELIRREGLCGEEILGFGDGVTEIEEVHRVGGTAVAVAYDADHGGINGWKRDRLVRAGADLVVPDFKEHEALLRYLLGEE